MLFKELVVNYQMKKMKILNIEFEQNQKYYKEKKEEEEEFLDQVMHLMDLKYVVMMLISMKEMHLDILKGNYMEQVNLIMKVMNNL